jgi:hypothetical protein
MLPFIIDDDDRGLVACARSPIYFHQQFVLYQFCICLFRLPWLQSPDSQELPFALATLAACR